MAVAPIRIPNLRQDRPIVDRDGRMTTEFFRRLSDVLGSLGYTVNAILAIPEIQAQLLELDQAIIDANAAAEAARDAADASAAETSIVNSFPTGYAGALLSVTAAGMVTIAAHQRQYGDTTLNPTVPVNGGTVATGAAPSDVIRVFYDQPSRAGGAVTYQFTIDPAAAPVQGGDRHVVGSVRVPATGTSDGNGVRPPGFVEP